MRLPRGCELGVFLTLLGSYAFFWHSRDWNSASRLMLTYALVDRHTIALNGLENQTRDIARLGGRYYTDKLPGYSLLAAIPYAIEKPIFRQRSHPLNHPADDLAHWPADYWVTLGTSGVLSAWTALLLMGLARDLGCGPGRASLISLAYGLATPAYVYATLAYGHQASSFALLASFVLLWRTDAPRPRPRMIAAGFLAAYAAVIELQVGPVSAILGCYLLAQVVGRRRDASNLGEFAVGALVPTIILLVYNQLAFGSPLDMGYFHEVLPQFRAVHNARNPIGLARPDAQRALALLWGGYRGLLFYAPILVLAVPGWVVLMRRRLYGLASISLLVCLAVYLVNLSYPEWTGGWSTGPRLLVPLLPFAMIAVAASLANGSRALLGSAIILALWGAILMLLFQGAGGRISQDYPDPLREAVWPRWSGAPLPPWTVGDRFAWNAVSVFFGKMLRHIPQALRWLQFAPLVVWQLSAVTLLTWLCACSRVRRDAEPTRYATSPVEATRAES